MTAIVVVTIVAALIFDVINGFHDAANSIATVVSTRVLTPKIAVLWAAVFNFVALFIFHQGVADTISKIITIHKSETYAIIVVCGLSGAILWNLFTWFLGLPSSSSHALIGGISGAGVAFAGPQVLEWENLRKTLEFIVLAPLIGLVLGSSLMFVVFWLFRGYRPQRVDRIFRVGQLISAAAYSIGHGGNDAQKTIGVIWAVMIAGGMLDAHAHAAPAWAVIASYTAMAIGTAVGGWRIVKTMGMGLTHLKPVGGFCAEIGGAITLFTATLLRIPVSTTWVLAAQIVWAWILTIPAAGAVGALAVLACQAAGAIPR
ncbi:MAG: inorganic phosphate transporter [Deltaproteobacteria bacterium]|nr:MAG: inorganic phosphate transporter [Deltaproteobacteria bacterium]